MNDRATESLQAKLRQFTNGLTPKEQAHLRLIGTDDVTGMVSTSLWDKAQDVVDQLTPEERAQLHRLLQDADVRGYMRNLYDVNPLDPYAGRPNPDRTPTTGGGGGLVPFSGSTLGLLTLTFVGALAGAEDNQTQGGYYPAPR